MELFLYFSVLCLFFVLASFTLHFLFSKKKSLLAGGELPPGSNGWPIVGESLEFFSAIRECHPEKFIFDRIAKYSSKVFRSHLLGDQAAVLCGTDANKFLFSNEGKLVQSWYPKSAHKIIRPTTNEQAWDIRKKLTKYLKPESLLQYVRTMDEIAQGHFSSGWENKDQVEVLPLAKNYAFWLASKLFMSVDDPLEVAKILKPFQYVASGIFTIPIDFPGTAFNRAVRASSEVRKQIGLITKQRKIDLAEGKASPTQDLLSLLLLNPSEDGTFMTESEISGTIMGFILGGYDTSACVMTFIVKFLAELPEIYEGVYNEQMEIAKSKAPGELLTWNDIQKMKYSWNVVCEAMRVAPPFHGGFREAISDFMFNGFFIPKGWKIYWNVNLTHKNPKCFPDPHKFDPSRFDGSGPLPYTYIPFGGGPRMCPGKEYARLEILVFIHNLVKRFRWEKVIPDENIVMDPLLVPAKGLPVRLYPLKAQDC